MHQQQPFIPRPKGLGPAADRTMGTVPPDPEMMNDNRARWADAAVAVFMLDTDADPADAISDLLNDLMHLCDRDGDYEAFYSALARARDNYQAETGVTQ